MTNKLMATLVELHDHIDRRNLQKDKHHCNIPPIWALWRCGKTFSSPRWRAIKAHLEFAKKDPQMLETRFSGLIDLNSKHHVWSKPGTFHHLQSTIPKVKCAGNSLMLWGCCSAAGTEGFIRVEGKLNTAKYRDSFNENLVKAIQNRRWFIFQQDNDPKHTARVAYRQLCECPWVARPEPGLERNQIFLEKPENVCLTPSNLTELERWRGEEVRRRMADNYQMQVCKACCIILKKTWGCKGASTKYLKG